MKEFVDGKMLSTGFTTGTCAAVAAGCAADILFSDRDNNESDEVKYSITLPGGEEVSLDIFDISKGASDDAPKVCCGVKKYSGDDPDATDGLVIYAEVTCYSNSDKPGVEITGGEGVGVVTKPGLDRPVGDYAINSVPRQMIREAVESAAARWGLDPDKLLISVCIKVPGGEEVAKKTFNPRLGIEGGISIIGTTGIVHPMSKEAFVSAIRAEAGMRRAEGYDCIFYVPGNYGERFALDKLNADPVVQCGNFIGEAIDIAAEYGFTEAIFVGDFGKLVKCTLGIMNTHSRESDGRLEAIASAVALSGGDIGMIQKILGANTTKEALSLIKNQPFFDRTLEVLSEKLEYYLDARSRGALSVGAIMFSMEDESYVCVTNNLRSRYGTGKSFGHDLSGS